MYLKNISLTSLRNYSRLELELEPGLNLFFGDNAQGKTNLLEAACFLASLRSFRGVKGSELVCWGERQGAVSGLAVCLASSPERCAWAAAGQREKPGAGGMREAPGPRTGRRLAVSLADGKRKVTLNGKTPESARDYLLSLKTVSFSPEDIFLVKEYPSHRRRFLDRSVFHLNPGYLETANSYRAACAQYNAALKAADTSVVRAWEELIAPLAAEMVLKRTAQAGMLSDIAAGVFDRVLGGGGLEVSYRSSMKGADAGQLAESCREQMEKKRPEAIKRGYGLVGPHTDDMGIAISGRALKVSASRGQGRLALLSLSLADAELYAGVRGEYPVLLLDDVVSELDEKRRAALMEYIGAAGQTLMTSTARDAAPRAAHFRVENNTVQRV